MHNAGLGKEAAGHTLLEHRMRWASSTEGVRRTGSAVSAQISRNVLPPKSPAGKVSGLGAAPADGHAYKVLSQTVWRCGGTIVR